MSTTIESMTGVIIKSPFFSTQTSLDLFPPHPKLDKNPAAPHKYRVALLYGPNGSGKSTIAQGFREYVDSTNPKSVELSPVVGTNILKLSPRMKTEKFFVFDEEYVSNNIKVQKSGLDTIVLLGQQVQLEQRLKQLSQEITDVETAIQTQNEICKQYSTATNVMSPKYWTSTITRILQADGGWAETAGIRIKKHQIKSRVTENEIKRIGEIAPQKSESETIAEFEKLYEMYDSISATDTPIGTAISVACVPIEILKMTKELLTETPQCPILTPREQELLDVMGIATISTVKGFLSIQSNTTCPTCLQSVSEQYREQTLKRIDNILNRDVEEFRSKLRKVIITEIDPNIYMEYQVVDSVLVDRIIRQILDLNYKIAKHNQLVQAKTNAPLTVMSYDASSEIINDYTALNKLLTELEEKRCAYNQVVADKRTTEKTLSRLNDELGHYSIRRDYSALLLQREAQRADDEKLQSLQQHMDALVQEQQTLDAQRKNLQIAVEQINSSLSYIFCSKQRLELKLESDQLYHLKSSGQPVDPDKISCGERNALALCYFFTEIAKETELRSLYCDEMCLIIDDPVSSFDFENRVGILSFLRYKLNQILLACATTKALIMTHDVSVLFDLQKAMDEISPNCASVGKHAEYILFQLQNKKLIPFKYNTHNEYTRLMEYVYEYGCNPTESLELVIGNTTRRVLEAFSTFSFKEGIEKVTLNPSVLELIPDQNRREYFQNSMYRLVLNTESHYREAIQGVPEVSFYGRLSTEEKQRTARDVLCFMYSVNPAHVLSHLPSSKGDIERWLENI